MLTNENLTRMEGDEQSLLLHMLTNENLTRMEGDEVSQYLASLSSPLLPSILTEPLATKGTRRGALVRA